MKRLSFISIFISCWFLPCSFALPISDDFNDGIIDSAIWNVSTPFGQSAVLEQGGVAALIARGGLQTVSDLPNAIEISGRFRLTHSLDNIKIAFRSDLTTTSTFAELSGMIVEFNAGGGTFIAPGGGSAASVIGNSLSTYDANLGSFHSFRIVDDGLNIQVFLDGASTPVVWGAINHRTGQRAAFYNREFSGLRAELDFVQIAAVPETLPAWVNGAFVALLLAFPRRNKAL